MKEMESVITALAETNAGAQIKAIAEFYDSTVHAFESFQEEYHVHCADGCGTCCTHFTPDITPSEALILAAYFLFVQERSELMSMFAHYEGTGTDQCPLYRPDRPFHCSVYPVRPLICRLFGNCCSQDKNGGPAFRRCIYNPRPELMPAILSSSDFDPEAVVPIMEKFGISLLELEGNQPETELLPEAVLHSMERLVFLSGFLSTGPEPNSDPSAPVAS